MLALLVLLLSSLALADCPSFRSGWNRLTVDGEPRAVWALLPPKEGPAPLLVALNGTTENGLLFAGRARLSDFADRGFLVLAPSSAGHGSLWPVWDAMRPPGEESAPNADLALFDALVACAVSQGAADPEQVWVTGHSAGGSMTNHILQRRADVLAGAIVASGIYGNTSPVGPVDLKDRLVLVTWGGENDRWSGRAGNVRVKDIGFEAEAAAASQAYARQGARVVTCRGAEVGHAWLDELNGWMIDLLLANPRGSQGLALAPLPALDRAPACVAGPFEDEPGQQIDCGGADLCADACQLFADCAVENPTVGPVLARELRALGFEAGSCGSCAERCRAVALDTADEAALRCVQQHSGAMCGGGVAGARPLIDAINTCCAEAPGSAWCAEVCGALRGNSAARAYFPTCREGG